MKGLTIRALDEGDLVWAEELLGSSFAGRAQARLGEVVDPLACPGLVAELDRRRVGIVTYRDDDGDVEIVYLEAVIRHVGVGTALVEAVVKSTGPARLWLVTTNDNLDALRFYQRRGFAISDIRVGAVDGARRSLKPTIPEVGSFGIPLRDEILLERRALYP